MKVGDKIKVIDEIVKNKINLKNQYGVIVKVVYLLKEKGPWYYAVEFPFMMKPVYIRGKHMRLRI